MTAITLLQNQLKDVLRSNFTDPGTGAANRTNSKGIFADMPPQKLTDAEFPRTSVLEADATAVAQEVNGTTNERTRIFNIITWVKRDKPLTISGTAYSNEYLLAWYHQQWDNILQAHWQDIANDVSNYEVISESQPDYDEMRQALFRIFTVRVSYMR